MDLTKYLSEHDTKLDLSGTKITELPKSISHLSKLERLEFSDTKVAELPEWIEGLTNLRYLDLSCTEITELPIFVTRMKSLNEVYWYGSKIVHHSPQIQKFLNGLSYGQ